MSVSHRLLEWYRLNRRDLPWRATLDPYRVWVSEVILQQTRVDQGEPYYHRFLARFPDVASLARAPEQEVLRVWQGLGYYSRARNMHTAARQVVERHGGVFPSDYSTLISLKGVGPYTAAAVASIVAGEEVPVVDGNVVRVITRLYGITADPSLAATRRQIRDQMQQLLSGHHPGDLNQAVMEFGALQCTPLTPRCDNCPLQDLCQAFHKGMVSSLPVKRRKADLRDRYLQYLVFRSAKQTGQVFLERREDGGIWKGLYTFPFVESPHALDPVRLSSLRAFRRLMKGREYQLGPRVWTYRHILSHQRIHATFHLIYVDRPEGWGQGFHQAAIDRLEEYPMPRLMLRFLEETDYLSII